MEVTPATEDDVPALSELLGVLFQQEAEFRPDPERQSAGLRAILGRADVGQVLVLRDGPAAVGMVSLLFLPSTALGGRVALLEDMVVQPNTRGRGAGARLLHAAIEFARSVGCRRVTLLTDADNAAAQRFYGRHGFRRSAMIPMRLMLDCENPVGTNESAVGVNEWSFDGEQLRAKQLLLDWPYAGCGSRPRAS